MKLAKEDDRGTVAEILAQTLRELGVRYVFGVPSGNFVDYLAAIRKTEGIEFVLVSNEASGGFMADACWKLTGKPAACFGTVGPGACNLTTGVCCGYLDRSPMLAFSDEMSDDMMHRICQMNIDHQALFRPITKSTARLRPGRVRETLYRAMQTAMCEVPGPVQIGLPKELGECGSDEEFTRPMPVEKARQPDTVLLDKMENLFIKARKPVLALGITAVRAGVRELVVKIAERHRTPVVLTPMAKGMISEDHPSYAGVLAHALGNEVGRTHQQADLVVGIGFDPVELNYEDWIPDVPLVHIDTAPADLDRSAHMLACDVVGDLEPALMRLAALPVKGNDWNMEELAGRRKEMFAALDPPPGSFGPRAVLDSLREVLPEDGIMTCDVGAHCHLIGQQWRTPAPELQLMTNGCSTMGYGIPAAIAAKLCCPDRRVCCITGDGGLLMMAGEMATAVRLRTKIVFVVVTDRSLSLIRLKQDQKRHEPYGTRLYSGDYAPSGALFGVPVLTARSAGEYTSALDEAFAAEGPVIVEAFVDAGEYDDLLLKGNR
jgi:acetolactate synthase-1/2/3 large subunit